MATRARLMVESCDCGKVSCTCANLPFSDPPRVRASSAVDDLDRARVGRPSPADITSVRHLIQAMHRVGIAPPHSGARLSAAQLASLLADQSIADRISLRMLCVAADIMPQAAS
jgi:hypothetical protein